MCRTRGSTGSELGTGALVDLKPEACPENTEHVAKIHLRSNAGSL